MDITKNDNLFPFIEGGRQPANDMPMPEAMAIQAAIVETETE